MFSREKQLIASDTQWHRTNSLNNAQCHSQYKPLIQSGDPAAAHESFQPWSYRLQLQLMPNQIASHQSKAVQSISQHTNHSASITGGRLKICCESIYFVETFIWLVFLVLGLGFFCGEQNYLYSFAEANSSLIITYVLKRL